MLACWRSTLMHSSAADGAGVGVGVGVGVDSAGRR
jgi:hypothetical protein